MREKKKMKLKKFHLHPVTTFIILIGFTIILSWILSMFQVQATYNKLNITTGQTEKTLVAVENLLNYNGLKFLISEAAKNFVSFTTLSTLLIALIGMSVAQTTGFFDTFIKRVLIKINNQKLTFILLFLATISSLVNEIGYFILIPLAAIIFKENNRNPLAGIITAFTGVAFGYGVTLFVGSMEANLVPITEASARLIDSNYHVSLTSNLYIIILTAIVLSIVGTVIIEKFVVPKLGRYKDPETETKTEEEIEMIDEEEIEQQKLEEEVREKKGLKNALIATIFFVIFFIYSLLPGLPFSGMLLDMEATTYLAQVFGENSYFQDGFTFMISLYFIIIGLAYGKGAKTLKNDKELINECGKKLADIGSLIILIFFASQFIAVFRKTNIATILTAWGANLIEGVEFSGLPLVVLTLVVIGLMNLIAATPLAKWTILAPTIVPKLMQSNISPEFAQFLLRAGDSMTKGLTPLLPYFVILIGYLNMYNPNKNKSITVGRAIKLMIPYGIIISITWIVIAILWYLTGIPLGPNRFPTL